MSRIKIIGWTAMAVCVIGYAGMAAFIVLGKMEHLPLTQAMILAGVSAVVGEIGLWVGAGCLGLSLFKKRKALFDRLFRRNATPAPEA
ncbi:hypothetical protein JIP62_08515 [Brevundimonas vitis]|uniref:Uncharacterized protein n=1 Tax=Brevundimonas vitisensis TaxID=2800818 RepID=A0ABX7BJI0_9CAUL|nr:hypothetical protein [Brevundimonas vitisensis]QQQ17402.1 hypothetical protein JIP62_08515 [Brevundimonas vitisensis]